MPGNKNEEDYLKNIFSRITTPSPVWKQSIEMDTTYRTVGAHNKNNINIKATDNNNNISTSMKHAHIMPKYEIKTSTSSNRTSITSRKTKTQSLSVNFILREELIGNEVHNIRKLFHSKPWSFHHTFQTFDMERQKVVSKQPYYELSEEYPLMSPSVCHKGSSVLRYNIFVKEDFETMKQFYADLLRLQPMYEEANFCYFTIYSKNGAEIQLSLKHSKQLNIVPTERSFLKIQLDNVYESVHEVGAKISEIFCSDCAVLVTHDPEGNPILVTGKSRAGSSSSQSAATSSQRGTLSRSTRQQMDQWSDCSTGCSECFPSIDRRGYYTEQQYDSTYYNDSGYHNDMSSDDCDSSCDFRTYPRRYRMTNYRKNTHSRTDSYYGNNRHSTSSECTDKVLYDSLGRQYTCCVAYV